VTAATYLTRAVDELDLARREHGVERSLRHSREAAACAYVAVIALHGTETSVTRPLRELIDLAATLEELDACGADAWEIDDHIDDPSFEHAAADAALLARCAVSWAQQVFADHAERRA
jgi:hypothetical protein